MKSSQLEQSLMMASSLSLLHDLFSMKLSPRSAVAASVWLTMSQVQRDSSEILGRCEALQLCSNYLLCEEGTVDSGQGNSNGLQLYIKYSLTL